MSKKICVIGLGYIGLPTAALLANNGCKVHGVDIVKSTVDTINNGNIHIVEPGLDIFVKKAIESGNLKANIRPDFADVFIIAVPTPFKENFIPNLDYVSSATKSIAPFIKENNIVILESTSPVGTTKIVGEILAENGVDISKIYIAHCPERVLPGKIMSEIIYNDRIIGGLTKEATQKAADFYRMFVEGEIFQTDAKTAEMTKLTENSFRDVNIAFANELSILCDKFDINVWELIQLANRHPRVNILNPGCGVGGHCIAVDPWFIVYAGGKDAEMIKTARQINIFKSEWVFEKIKNAILNFELKNNKKPVVACMGLSFKPDIDDLRESPALAITERLANEYDHVIVVEPNIKSYMDFKIANVERAIELSDIVVFLVAHKEFKNLKPDKEILDFCGVFK